MRDNLLQLKCDLRAKLFSLKRKINSINLSIEGLYIEIDKIDQAFENLDCELEIYKNRISRTAGSEARKLQYKLKAFEGQTKKDLEETDAFKEILIASTVTIFDSIIYGICKNDEDLFAACYAALFPLVYSRLTGLDKFYLLDHVPDVAMEVVSDARKEFEEICRVCDGPLTTPYNWNMASELIFDYWRDKALPSLYGKVDQKWFSDSPYSLAEIQKWRTCESERAELMPKVNDAYLIKQRLKDEVIDSNGVVGFNRLLIAPS